MPCGSYIDVADLAGYRVGTRNGYSHVPDLKKIPNADLKLYDNDDACLRDLEAGRIDYAVLDGTTMGYVLAQNPGAEPKQVPITPNTQYPALSGKGQPVMGMTMENTDLFDAANAGVTWLWASKTNAACAADARPCRDRRRDAGPEARGRTVGSFVVSVPLGLLFGAFETSESRALRALAHVYVEVFRSVPVLTQLFILYFGLPAFGIVLPSFGAAVVALGLHSAASMSEIYRAGIAAVDGGQGEAASAIGMTRAEAMRHIVLPQAVRVILPPMGNSLVSLLKDTSVASLIAAPELMMRADDLTSDYYTPMQVYPLTGVMYFLMAFPLSRDVRWLERSMAHSRRIRRRRVMTRQS